MQTILGANGPIGYELAKELYAKYTRDIKLVSRNPVKVNDSDTLQQADLLDSVQTANAIAGSDIVYFTAGLPLDSSIWLRQWPILMQNVIDACLKHNAKLVYFDNTYMYPQNSHPQTESTPFLPNGDKGRVRGEIANMLLNAIQHNRITAMICRAPEFYGPGKTQSITNATVFEKVKQGRKPTVFVKDDKKRSLIYTPDASRAMALLGNTEDAYQQTWHLPCDDNRLTYRQLIELIEQVSKTKVAYKVLAKWQIQLASLFSHQIRETTELLPRYEVDNVFVSEKFKTHFPDFSVTTFEQGVKSILGK